MTDARPTRQHAGLNETHVKKSQWTVLYYLCGDHEPMSERIERIVAQTKTFSHCQDLRIVVQHDLPKEGATRFVVGDQTAGDDDEEEEEGKTLGPIDTGDVKQFVDFLQWGMEQCPSEHLAIVIAGSGVGDPDSVVGDIAGDSDYKRLFSCCDDATAQDALTPVELREVFETIASKRPDEDPIDLVMFDMCGMQYLEVAYQFDGVVKVMIGAQNNQRAPEWPHYEMLDKWQSLIHGGGRLTVGQMAVEAVTIIGREYVEAKYKADRPVVSAINLSHLDLVTRPIDAFFLTLMQSLGDKVIWRVREMAFQALLRESRGDAGSPRLLNTSGNDVVVQHQMVGYDILALLVALGRALDDIIHVDEGHDDEQKKIKTSATRAWYQGHLTKIHDPLKRDADPGPKASDSEKGIYQAGCVLGQEQKRLRDKVESLIDSASDSLEKQLKEVLENWVPTAQQLLKEIRKEGKHWRKHVNEDNVRAVVEASGAKYLKDRSKQASAIADLNHLVRVLEPMREEYLRRGFESFQDSIRSAMHLRNLVHKVAKLLEPRDPQEPDSFDIDGDREEDSRFVIACAPNPAEYSTPDDVSAGEKSNGSQPRYCGVSIYRPEDLDNLMNSRYLELDFHQRVHWVSLLGAVNLIGEHPRSMWRLISSLLATSRGGAREDLLRRLVGPDSVMTGMGEQFQALKKPPTLTLSIAVENDLHSVDPVSAGQEEGQRYRLTLDSSRKGATVTEQTSHVSRDTIDTTLSKLEQLLRQSHIDLADIDALDSLGKILGEDIIQDLHEYFEAEWCEINAEGGDEILHLQLQLPRELMRYPWELMHDGKQLLCQRYAMGRQVFMDTGLARRAPRRKSRAIRALIIGDPEFGAGFHDWPQLPGARQEAKEVADLFGLLGQELRGALDFNRARDVYIQEPVTKREFRKLLRDGSYDIVHFAGHAKYIDKDPDRSAWMFSDGPLWALEIRNTLSHCESPPWLVFANACEAGMDSEKSSRYQSNVFGLSTAFINQGVTAYMGPLWPINDAVALQIAKDFYNELLLARSTLGDALHFAKSQARKMTVGAAEASEHKVVQFGGLTSQSWASLILYGDPTMKLLDSLGESYSDERSETPAPGSMKKTQRTFASKWSMERRRKSTARVRGTRPIQASVAETQELVLGPRMKPDLLNTKHAMAELGRSDKALELVELNGVRYWQYYDPQTEVYESLPGSHVRDLLSDNERLRKKLGVRAGKKDYARIIGRWILAREESGFAGALAREYDELYAPKEQLLAVRPDRSTAKLGKAALRWVDGMARKQDTNRVLLLIHGTCSSTKFPIDSLGNEFIRWACRKYAAVIGFDHWTLSKSPEENAMDLWELLDDRLLKENRLDIVAQGRGGLVARAFVELMERLKKFRPRKGAKPSEIVRKIIFVGTPNSGTDLANPIHWGAAADLLVNLVHIDPDGLYGRLGGLFARFAPLVQTLGSETLIRKVPGLWAQNADALDEEDFLGRLQQVGAKPSVVSYAAVTANYQPGGDQNVMQIFHECADRSLDGFFGNQPNDIAGNTANVLAVDRTVETSRSSRLLGDWTAENVLIFDPDVAENHAPWSDTQDDAFKKRVVARAGVHHTNMLMMNETREFLKDRLG
jgi:hypothetical protein